MHFFSRKKQNRLFVKPKQRCAKKKNCNKVCHVCQVNLRIEYTNMKSCINNLFKPSLRSNSFDVIWEKKLTDVVGNNVKIALDLRNLLVVFASEKIKKYCELVKFLFRRFGLWNKRNFVAVSCLLFSPQNHKQ